MNTKQNAIQRAWTTTIHQTRERLEQHAANQRLRRDLASYTTPAQIDDLLSALDRVPDADAAPVRAILLANRKQHHQLEFLAI